MCHYCRFRKKDEASKYESLCLSDILKVSTIGVGGFGRVHLVSPATPARTNDALVEPYIHCPAFTVCYFLQSCLSCCWLLGLTYYHRNQDSISTNYMMFVCCQIVSPVIMSCTSFNHSTRSFKCGRLLRHVLFCLPSSPTLSIYAFFKRKCSYIPLECIISSGCTSDFHYSVILWLMTSATNF